MQRIDFLALCPYEIGDQVTVLPAVAPDAELYIKQIGTITDIVTLISAKTGTIEFVYELDNSGEYIKLQKK